MSEKGSGEKNNTSEVATADFSKFSDEEMISAGVVDPQKWRYYYENNGIDIRFDDIPKIKEKGNESATSNEDIDEIVNEGYTRILNEEEKAALANNPYAEMINRIKDESDESYKELHAYERSILEFGDKLEDIEKQLHDLSGGDEALLKVYRDGYLHLRAAGMSADMDSSELSRAYRLLEEEAQTKIIKESLEDGYPESQLRYLLAKVGLEMSSKLSGNDTEDSVLMIDSFRAKFLQESLVLNPESKGAYEIVFAAVGFENIEEEDRQTLISLIADQKIKISEGQKIVIVGEMDSDQAKETRSILIGLADKYQRKLMEMYFSPQKEQLELDSAKKRYAKALDIISNNDSGVTAMLRMVYEYGFEEFSEEGDQGNRRGRKLIETKKELLAKTQEALISGLIKFDITGEIVPGDLGEKSQQKFDELRNEIFNTLNNMQENETEVELLHSVELDAVIELAVLRLNKIQEEIQQLEKEIYSEQNKAFNATSTRLVAYIARHIHSGSKHDSNEHTNTLNQYAQYEANLGKRMELSKEYNELASLIECARAEMQMRVAGLVELRTSFVENMTNFDVLGADPASRIEAYKKITAVLQNSELAAFFDAPPESARDKLAEFKGVYVDEDLKDLEFVINDAEAREQVTNERKEEIRDYLKEKLLNEYISKCKERGIKDFDAIIKTCFEVEGYSDIFDQYCDRYILQEGFTNFLANYFANEKMQVNDSVSLNTIMHDIRILQEGKSELKFQLDKYFNEFVTKARALLLVAKLKQSSLNMVGKVLKLSDGDRSLLSGEVDFDKILDSVVHGIDTKIKGASGVDLESDDLIIAEMENTAEQDRKEEAQKTSPIESSTINTDVSVDTSDFDSSSDFSASYRAPRYENHSAISSASSRLGKNKQKSGFLQGVWGFFTAILGF